MRRFALLLVWVAGCFYEADSPLPEDFGTCSEVAEAPGVAAPTWYRDVEPIVARKCQGCHTDTGVAPFALTAYQNFVPMREVIYRTVEERVRDGDVDLAVIGGHVLGPSERCVAAGIVDELQLIVPPNYPLKDVPLPPARLARERLLIREEGSATRQATERALRQAGVSFRPAMELDHTETIKRAVMAGLGVAFVSRYAVEDEVRGGRLRVLSVQRMKIRRHFHVIHDERRPLSASARAFTAFLEANGGMPGPPRPASARHASERHE